MTDAKSPHHVESLREQAIDTRKRAQMVYFSERTLELLIPKVTLPVHTAASMPFISEMGLPVIISRLSSLFHSKKTYQKLSCARHCIRIWDILFS